MMGARKVKVDFCIDQFEAKTFPYPAALCQLFQKSAGAHLLASDIKCHIAYQNIMRNAINQIE